ncbi:protein MFI [Biomphalaria glabrata]|nr:protein MFI [Biomphalaria glabrata]
MDSENPIARLQKEQLYHQYVQEQILDNVPKENIATFSFFLTNLADHWRPQHLKQSNSNQDSVINKNDPNRNTSKQNVLLPRRSEARNIHNEIQAAVKIQRAWRRHIDIQVYKYYRDLINFKCRGDPSAMLRCINPNEAKLLDAAAGINIRFRLAGEKFPPNIYYKIFTNRPIQDLCANSPKDYTQSKKLTAKDTHSHVRVPKIQEDDKQGWYKRIENNGWRLVSDRLIHHILNDPVTWETSRKEYKFDHSRLNRRQDVERRKKEKKIKWMQKLYSQGLLKTKADDEETTQLIEGATAGMIATIESQGVDALENWEVDELLAWTTGLNFDEYRDTWRELATSSSSQQVIEERFKLSTNSDDPFEVSLSTGPSRYPSTRQSHFTNVTLNTGRAMEKNSLITNPGF